MIEQIIKNLENDKITILPEKYLSEILKESIIIEEADTFFNDKIRILKFAEIILTQEKAKKSEIIFRKTFSTLEAEEFIKNRLKMYERMWDGCGCKIDYYE